MPRGGKRQGRPGRAYGNRTDLNKPPAAHYTGQQYGMAAEQARAQAAVPVAPPPSPPPPPAQRPTGENPQPGPAPAPQGPLPGSLGAFDRPSGRPAEPITSGLPGGPGVGPEAITEPGIGGDALELQLRALYQKFPIPEIARLLED